MRARVTDTVRAYGIFAGRACGTSSAPTGMALTAVQARPVRRSTGGERDPAYVGLLGGWFLCGAAMSTRHGEKKISPPKVDHLKVCKVWSRALYVHSRMTVLVAAAVSLGA